MKLTYKLLAISVLLLTVLLAWLLSYGNVSAAYAPPVQQADNPEPPTMPVKLIFIHHSTGENWLADGYGDLGLSLAQNNYFVSDTNYGWGPDSIGDRTDIPNWSEWFRSENTPNYMEALFNESGQHSGYTRTFADSGGENQIVMFKSCFPNSDLYGNPDDPPTPGHDFTVGNAKYIYNEILQYFATRPDKLFIVITAPPLSDPSNAANARAFNLWLMNDWLRENSYPHSNVAVFDFYNVLTESDAHHRYDNGRVEHVVGSRNTLHYPSSPGDDHPSVEGSRKATVEFISLLNIFYHRWQTEAPPQPPVSTTEPQAPVATQPSASPLPSGTLGLFDDFESGPPSGTNGWEAFWDEATTTTIVCATESGNAHSGSASLRLDFNVAPDSWTTCGLFFEGQQDWSDVDGLSFYLRAEQAGLVFNVDIYAGSHEDRETYIHTIETPYEGADGWIHIELPWEHFHRADWEENAGASFDSPDRVLGVAFGFNAYPGIPNTGTLWVDDFGLVTGSEAALSTATTAPAEVGSPSTASETTTVASPSNESPSGGGSCLPGLLPLAFLALTPTILKRVKCSMN